MEPEKEHARVEETNSPSDELCPQPIDNTIQPSLTDAQQTWARVIGRLLAAAWIEEQKGTESS